MSTRYRFMSDDDGHDYLIEDGDVEKFENWLKAGPYWEDYDGKDFFDMALGTSVHFFTFTDPKEDE